MTRRLREAFKTGLATYVVTTFALALFVSPVVASHADFGHVHPDNNPAHVHSVASVFGSDAAVSGLELRFAVGTSLAVLVLVTALVTDKPRTSPVGSRAPPVVVS